jgi:hypothetical protein
MPQAALAQGAATPFTQLGGSWHGSGTVRLAQGGSERLTCRGSYTPKSGGSELALTIRCQSENSNIEMKSSLSYEGGRVSGNWQERNFGLEGEVSGAANPSKLSLRISGQIQGSMVISVSGSAHQVRIYTGGPGFKSVAINFTRG